MSKNQLNDNVSLTRFCDETQLQFLQEGVRDAAMAHGKMAKKKQAKKEQFSALGPQEAACAAAAILEDYQNGEELEMVRLQQNGGHFEDDIFEVFSQLSGLNFLLYYNFTVPEGPIMVKSVLAQVMVWHETGSKPLPDSVLNKICDDIWHQETTMS